jgi:hypothetical protein
VLAFAALQAQEADLSDVIAQFEDRAATVKVDEGSQQLIDPTAIPPN